ncbi:response regulator, partial [Nonomuraea sp. NPDC001684]
MTGPAPIAPPISAAAAIGTPHLTNVPLRISLLNGMSMTRACGMHPVAGLRLSETPLSLLSGVSAQGRENQHMRVLVVEDERRMAAALQRGLQAEGFAVDLAHDGEEGLHAARQGDYDVVVLDIMLPRLSG